LADFLFLAGNGAAGMLKARQGRACRGARVLCADSPRRQKKKSALCSAEYGSGQNRSAAGAAERSGKEKWRRGHAKKSLGLCGKIC
jgi:hypothetical protein